MSTIFAGPWVGEFGWELCWWNPMLRALSRGHERIIVAAPATSRYLYEFADEFIPLDTEGRKYAEGSLKSRPPTINPDWERCDPARLWVRHGEAEAAALRTGAPVRTPKTWRNLAPEPSFVADILCAFRPEKIVQGRRIPGKAYPREQCRALVHLLLDAGYSAGCYGAPDNYWFDGTVDLRGAPLEAQCAALAAAQCAVGPSSGPIHLASLCGCPHVTWYAISHASKIRYTGGWNPFQTPVRFLQGVPDPATVLAAVRVDTPAGAYG